MTFLPQGYTKPDTRVEDQYNYLLSQAQEGKSWARMKLFTEYGEGDNLAELQESSGEPPADYNKLK